MPKASTYQELKRVRASQASVAKVPYQETVVTPRGTRRELSEVPDDKDEDDRDKHLVVKMFSNR